MGAAWDIVVAGVNDGYLVRGADLPGPRDAGNDYG